MTFTPQDTRLAQIAAAENLLHEIDPAKAYPYEFVVFRITGFRPKTKPGSGLLTGLALQHDLGLLIEQLSEDLDIQTISLAEPVLAIDDVTEKFNVTSKTIQRWRRRGLPARRFVFGDGKRRVGFLLSSVERFVAAHQDQVSRGTNFSQVSAEEREEILRRARRLAEMCHCCTHEIARRIARKMNRSPLTILHTIRKHDQENPQAAIFPSAAEPIGETERAKVLRSARHGLSLGAIARRACRTRSDVYRVLVDERIAKLNRRKVRFIDDELYHQPDSAEVLDELVRQEGLATAAKAEESRVPKDLPPYLADLYRTPLLTPARERALFLKFNFHKFQFVQARRKLEPQFARVRELNELEGHLRRATETKNAVVRANLRLVVSIARKHLRPGLNLMELISDGNITLMRAVESFDVHKGNRFSTYATLALMKGFARSVPLMRGKVIAGADGAIVQTVHHEEVLANVPDARPEAVTDRLIRRDEVNQLLSRLNDRERMVLKAHFGLEDEHRDDRDNRATATQPATYEQVGEHLGLSKQRVRQIEQTALAKLRAAAETLPAR
jgi:RNA polymerase sigma factor (sigma-70 family)